MTLHRKIKHNEKVCRAHDLGSYAQGQGCSQVRGQNLVPAITKTTEANLTKHHRKLEHREGVSRTRDLRGHLLHTVTFLVFYIDNGMLCALIRIASMRRF